jgi:electron transfer flavoprotein alpha/beta subunit
MQTALESAINLKEGQVRIVDLGNNENAARRSTTVLGLGLPGGQRGVVVA